MCQSEVNSLKSNLAAQGKMLLEVVVPLDRMPKLRADAENAERVYQRLMKSEGWTPKQLFEITGYRVIASVPPINH